MRAIVMAYCSDVVDKIMRYKVQLTNTEEAAKLLKTLKKLKDLEITLDVLAETGIGKTVNTLRRHELAGDLAKSLVRDWKRLVPKGSKSPTSDNIATEELPCKDKLSSHVCAKDDLNNNCLTDEREEEEPENKKIKKDHFDFRKDTDQLKKQHISRDDFLNKSKEIEKEKKNIFDQCHKLLSDKNRIKSQKSEDILGQRKCKSKKRRKYSPFSDDESDHSDGDKKPVKETKSKGQLCPESSHKKSKDEQSTVNDTEAVNKKKKKHNSHKCEKKSKSLLSKSENIKPRKDGNSDTEQPMMSFESCLNYDENVSRRTERPKPLRKKHPKSKHLLKTKPVKVVNFEPEEEPVKPLPSSSFPDCPIESTSESVLKILESSPVELWLPEGLTSHQRKAEKVGDSCDVLDESAIFTGQRLNKKMQVYSGAKTIFLPAMMSLYQQCIRTLQNNINLLYETGGVPFEILEPVLERCTPEQLLRIEEYNPVYIGETDHLWGKHCKRDFRDAKLQEYESWKEMYLRLSEERERKFKTLTKTIVSAQSSKPKGRQVKMAFIHSVAKPPRDVRIKQEIHGTAVQQPQPKCSVKIQSSRSRHVSKEPSSASSSSATSTTSNSLDPRKKTKVAPMMAKSLKTFKKQFGRR